MKTTPTAVMAALAALALPVEALAHLTGDPAHDGAHATGLTGIALAVALLAAVAGRPLAARGARWLDRRRSRRD